MKILPYAALVAVLTVAGPALAQTGASRAAQPPTTSSPSSDAPSTAAPPSSATAPTGTDTAANAGASTEVASGMSVKDNTGAAIGQVTGVKNGMATIKMGTDSFTVETSKLGVQNGAATINATQADLKKMMPKK